MPAVANLIWETSTTGGSGPLVVTKVSGARRFSDAFTLGGTDAFYIYASNPTGDEWQLGSGHLSDADTIVWDTILQSSNNDNAVNFSAGLIDLTNDIPANKQVQTDAVQTLTNKTLTAPVINSPTGITKSDVGLGDVDNTSDADKPVSTATQTALDLKANTADLAAVATSGSQDDMSDGTTNKNFTATEQTKLAGVEALADVTDAGNVAAAGAFMKASDDSDDITEGTTNLFATPANISSAFHSASNKTTPIDTDEFALADSATSPSWTLKKVTWANIKATISTYLALGTAALKNTGTSGNSVPLLDGTNTASGAWDFQQTGSFAVPITATSSNADAVQGPNIKCLRNSSSPAANDSIGAILFQGRDDAAGFPIYGTMLVNVLDPAAASADGEFVLQATVNNVAVNSVSVSNGIKIGTPTGSYKGFGAINCSDAYNDNVALTCMALAAEFKKGGEIDLDKWDSFIPDVIIPQTVTRTPRLESSTEYFTVKTDDGYEVQKRNGKKQATELAPVWDEKGNGIGAIDEPLYDEAVVPEQVIKRQHQTARLFAKMVADGFDPRDPAKYVLKLRTDEALPGMPTQAEWAERGHNSFSQSELFMRKWLALEMLALVVADHEDRMQKAGI